VIQMSNGEIFKVGDEVVVVRDHDGIDGRWVCCPATIIDKASPDEKFPWCIASFSGAFMYCDDEMITHARAFDEIPEFGGRKKDSSS
jgi:hypothetical protein